MLKNKSMRAGMKMEYVILVDKDDNETGREEKLKAHIEGKLHRAFSIFVFNKKRELLLQKRASGKYHCGGLWSNSCCSHPRPGEQMDEAIHRRLAEEMGFDCRMAHTGKAAYKIAFKNKLTEHEIDHVFAGEYEGEIHPNPSEVSEYKWISVDALKKDILQNPEKYTPWLRIILEETDFRK
jgi:isopentenyl-diphosphate delta-isomerase